jgi:hypothetical protein
MAEKRWRIRGRQVLGSHGSSHQELIVTAGPFLDNGEEVEVIPATAWDTREEQLRGLVEWLSEQAEEYAREVRMWPESADEHYGNRDAYERAAERLSILLDESRPDDSCPNCGASPLTDDCREHTCLPRAPSTRPGLLDKEEEHG